MAYDPTLSVPEAITHQPNAATWRYESADNAATVSADDYFADGASRGMHDGDIVFVVNKAVNPATVTTTTANFA